ncbi:GNAT family N-acetyltransferase [Povalibacter sp.]|uniref:GNAT family N-acetyltransferase n=1 Tax=Povalibacter sp. TaxID=1962978 RepID=UPI002F429BCF
MHRIIEADLSNERHCSAIVEMIAAHAASEFGRRQAMTHDERARLIPALANFPAKHVLLLVEGTEVCGLAICFRQLSTFSGKEMLKLHDLFVCDRYRGRGYGRALVEATIGLGRERNCAFVNVEVATDNPIAVKLYDQLGFRDWLTPTKFLELRLPG